MQVHSDCSQYLRDLFGAVALLILLAAAATVNGADVPALSLHPDNPKYFLFRGKPAVLIAASEHAAD